MSNQEKKSNETQKESPDDSEVEIKVIDSEHNESDESEKESPKVPSGKFKELLEVEKQKLSLCEDKLKRTLADFQNLERKTKTDIVNGVNIKIDKFMKNFLSIYDDFVRAKTVLAEEKVNVDGLEAILKNMNSLLSEYDVTSIDALGEIFDPNLHEAISVIEDPDLDEGTITKEIRKGYISNKRVIRPSIVEISKKSQPKKSDSE